jgi:hypothetical protein
VLSGAPSRVTVAPIRNPEPLMKSGVRPSVEPIFGEIEVTTGGALNVNRPAAVAACPSGLVTTTSTVPGACPSVVAVIDVLLSELTVAVAPPNVTLAPASNRSPTIVTAVAPLVAPVAGVTEEIAGPNGDGGVSCVCPSQASGTAPITRGIPCSFDYRLVRHALENPL